MATTTRTKLVTNTVSGIWSHYAGHPLRSSTARGWLTKPHALVLIVDAVEMDSSQLQWKYFS